MRDMNFYGALWAYKKMVGMLVADEVGPARRFARDLTTEVRECIIGIACAEKDAHPLDEESELVIFLCKEENQLKEMK